MLFVFLVWYFCDVSFACGIYWIIFCVNIMYCSLGNDETVCSVWMQLCHAILTRRICCLATHCLATFLSDKSYFDASASMVRIFDWRCIHEYAKGNISLSLSLSFSLSLSAVLVILKNVRMFRIVRNCIIYQTLHCSCIPLKYNRPHAIRCRSYPHDPLV